MQFYRDDPTARTSWRLAILMGVNTRTYKFALGSALLELGQQGRDIVTLRELARLYAARLLDRDSGFSQAPSANALGDNDFLNVMNRERAESLSGGQPTDALVDAAAKSIPGMVMQKFHNLRTVGQVAHTFYEIEGRGMNRFVRLTPDLLHVATDPEVLSDELSARWSIVEASFDAGIGRNLIENGVELDDDLSAIVSPARRVALTSLRGAIAGFQHGRCFYCQEPLSNLVDDVEVNPVISGKNVHVDHVVPFSWMKTGSWTGPNLNHVWNLVLAHASCNLQKSARQPTNDELTRLIARNDAIAESPHPLRRTIEITMDARGANADRRRRLFMRDVITAVTDGLPKTR